jgi:hypothetical protein
MLQQVSHSLEQQQLAKHGKCASSSTALSSSHTVMLKIKNHLLDCHFKEGVPFQVAAKTALQEIVRVTFRRLSNTFMKTEK